MKYQRCGRCELNYSENGGLCDVCKRELRGEAVEESEVNYCQLCGEETAEDEIYCGICKKLSEYF